MRLHFHPEMLIPLVWACLALIYCFAGARSDAIPRRNYQSRARMYRFVFRREYRMDEAKYIHGERWVAGTMAVLLVPVIVMCILGVLGVFDPA